jgi:uracil-DNA glycosylase
MKEIHPSWHPLFIGHVDSINRILHSIDNEEVAPSRQNIFRAFQQPLDSVKVLIVGQDPYPAAGVADGLAFSIQHNQESIPASLRNIFKEYSSDLGLPSPTSGDLSPWSERGVMLLNRSLTTAVGLRNAHSENGWSIVTEEVAKVLGQTDVVAILWGSYAQQLAPFFQFRIETPHPSPLSAYRGFFGSRPFSRTNQMLRDLKRHEIDWRLK